MSDPVILPPVEPVAEEPAPEPAVEEPVVEEPVVEEPVAEEPTAEQLAQEEAERLAAAELAKVEDLLDYTFVVRKYRLQLQEIKLRKDANVAKKEKLESSLYASLTIDEITRLTYTINLDEDKSRRIRDIIAEIEALGAISAEDKTLLYYFWTVVDAPRGEYKAKTLFNFRDALANDNIKLLLSDETTPVEIKTEVAKLIYNKYKLKPEYVRELLEIYKFA